MGFSPERGDNPRALARGLFYVQVDKHRITILYHLHQCKTCTTHEIKNTVKEKQLALSLSLSLSLSYETRKDTKNNVTKQASHYPQYVKKPL